MTLWIGNMNQSTPIMEKIIEILSYAPKINKNTGEIVKDIKGKIEFLDVSFWYSKKQLSHILDKISFRIEQGECVAFVGMSGSGKSTIVKLIERFYDPNEGNIFIDDKNIKEY